MDQATHNKIVSFIWGIADDVLRDLFKRGKYPDVILPMCVLRRLDAVLEPTKKAVLETRAILEKAGISEERVALCQASGQAFYNKSKFTLRDLKSRGSQQQLRADFEAYLDGFSSNVQDILDNFKFRNQIPTLSKADALGTLIDKFLDPEINLSPNPVLHGDGSVKHPALDNHAMGTVFEELVRKFNEDNNEEAGEHWTPRDAVRLMANLIFLPVADQIRSGSYLLYDCACGTGGMLTVAEETLQSLASARGNEVVTHLHGQEINPETYAICKADMLLKGEGENAEHIVGGAEWSTLSHDAFPALEFDFMLANPPYGKSWKKDLEAMGGKEGMRDPRFKVMHNDEELSLVKVKHVPFHAYTMKQAIEERFILDVLKSYTPVDSYYRLVKTVPGDPEFDTKKAQKKLRRYVESHDHAIRTKAEIMVDHFHEQVLALNKIGGHARAMVVCSGIERAIQYFHAFREYLLELKSPYQAIVAFSGEFEYGGANVTEASLNGFPSGDIAEKIQEDPYRFLICADKFQTGYDEPLLHTMYVDKPLAGIKAVQTLSRLNRAHPDKHDVFVLDFMNNTETITKAFSDYYRTTVLSEETDPNKLHTLKTALDARQVYSQEQVDTLAERYLGGAGRETLDPILDDCVAVYIADLNEDEQVDFKGKAKAFTRTYDFLASILPYTNRGWEKLSILLNFLIPKLPAPKEEDLAKGILEAIDMDSYRAEKQAALRIAVPDANAEIDPSPVSGGGRKPEPELDRLSNILKSFNDQFGTLFNDADRVARRIRDDIAPQVAADHAYQNAKKNTPNAARIEHDKALARVMLTLLKDDTEVYKQFVENESFRRFVTDMVFNLTSE